MPAILRNSLPNRVASPCNIASHGSCAMVGSVGQACRSGTRCRADHSVASPPPPYSLGSLWPSVLAAVRFPDSVPAVTNAYRIPCSLCETGWCFWFGDPATYQSLPHGTCTLGWILVRWRRPLPRLTIHYHACLLGLHRFLTFTSHHLRPDTHTDTHREHTHIEHSMNTAQSEHGGPE